MSKCGREYRKNSGQKSGFIAASGARFSDKSLLSRSKKAMSKNPIFFINFLDVSDNSKTKKIIFFKFQKFFCRNYFFIFSKNFSTKIFLPCFDSKIFDLKQKNTLISVKNTFIAIWHQDQTGKIIEISQMSSFEGQIRKHFYFHEIYFYTYLDEKCNCQSIKSNPNSIWHQGEKL